MFFVYALYSEAHNKIYIGYSSNPEKRLVAHYDERNRGCTGKFRHWKLVYTERCNSKTEALKREKQMKSAHGRKFVWDLIAINKPHFEQ